MKAIILAGGLGTRLSALVPDRPKPMATIRGRPFLELLLDQLIRFDIVEITLAVGYRADLIEAHFGARYGKAHLTYSREDRPLGTGGAVVRALAASTPAPALVLNGDTLVCLDYRKLLTWYEVNPSAVAMVLREVDDVSRFGAVVTSGETVVKFEEKGGSGRGLINAGVYIVHSGLFSRYELPDRFSFETDFLQRYCRDLRPRAFITGAYFIDIGTPESFELAQSQLPSALP